MEAGPTSRVGRRGAQEGEALHPTGPRPAPSSALPGGSPRSGLHWTLLGVWGPRGYRLPKNRQQRGPEPLLTGPRLGVRPIGGCSVPEAPRVPGFGCGAAIPDPSSSRDPLPNCHRAGPASHLCCPHRQPGPQTHSKTERAASFLPPEAAGCRCSVNTGTQAAAPCPPGPPQDSGFPGVEVGGQILHPEFLLEGGVLSQGALISQGLKL